MTAALQLVARGYGALGLPRLTRRRGPLIVMYHGIGGADGVDVAAFAQQLAALCARRRVVPLQEAVRRLDHPDARELAALTFDDGYRDFAERALPVLAERELHATLFVPAGHLGGHNAWDDGRMQRREILDAAGLRALPQRFVEIGAHGYSHCRMSGLAPAALERETREARERLEDAIGRTVALFAYPFGQLDDFDDDAERAVRASGYAAACSTHFGRGSRAAERFRLRRVGIEPADTAESVAAKLDGGYDWVALKESLGAALRARASRRGRS